MSSDNQEADEEMDIYELVDEVLRYAAEAADAGERPFAALAVDAGGVSHAISRVNTLGDPTLHAEVVLLRQIAPESGDRSATTIVTSCEPCAMCALALYRAGVRKVIFAAPREVAARFGFADTVDYDRASDLLSSLGLTLEHVDAKRALWPFERYARRPAPASSIVEYSAAECLASTGAIAFNASEFFTFTSGATSPIYVDNRHLLGFPRERGRISYLLARLLARRYPTVDALAGTSTAGIPWAIAVAERLELPMCYVRAQAKDWGKQRAVEGFREPGATVAIVEDLLYSGGSAITTAERLKEEGMSPVGVVSIVDYGLATTAKRLTDEGLTSSSLTTVSGLAEQSRLSIEEKRAIYEWLERQGSAI